MILVDRTRLERAAILFICLLSAAAIAAVDSLRLGDSFSVLYIVPLLVLALYLSRWQMLVCAVIAAALREQFSPVPWGGNAPARFVMGLSAFAGASLFIVEMIQGQRANEESVKKLKNEIALRREAEEDARVVIESSPAAIITVDSAGRIELANDAAKRLLGFSSEPATGHNISDYFPMLGDLIKSKRAVSLVRTMVEGSGRRRNGEVFFAQMWLSNYKTPAGAKLAAVVADATEQLRVREELGLRQLLTNSRIIAGAVSHEIRNLSAAASMLHDNIGRSFGVVGNEDFEALGSLIEAMRKLSSSDVPASAEEVLTGVDMNALLGELEIVLSSAVDGDQVELRWEVVDNLPRVRADHSGLLQVFLNLTQNSRRALHGRPNARITIAAYQLGGSVLVRVADNGRGIASPETLFKPFQPGAASAGLGLYISRAIVRTYGGELQYMQRPKESHFLIELPAIEAETETANA
jgi:two-component system, LuxR family, sensor kinase FixL